MRALLALVALAVPAVAAPVPKALKKGVDLDGVWEVTELHSDGTPPTEHRARWTIRGEEMVYETTADGQTYSAASNATFALVRADDGGASFDYVVKYKAGRQETFPGVVETDGDTLKFCYSITNPRVRPVACKPANGTTMFVFKRATPNK